MPVSAMDADIGHVVDLLFDAQSWRLLYLEAATGWLFGRDVIVPVQRVSRLDIPGGPVHVDLPKARMEATPALDSQAGFDEAYERALLAYYGIAETRRHPNRTDPVSGQGGPTVRGWLAPMRASELDGYQLEAETEIVGTVQDLLLDVDNWRVNSLIAEIGGFLVPDMAEVGIGPVTGIDRDNKIVHVAVSKQAVGRMARLRDEELPYVLPKEPPS